MRNYSGISTKTGQLSVVRVSVAIISGSSIPVQLKVMQAGITLSGFNVMVYSLLTGQMTLASVISRYL